MSLSKETTEKIITLLTESLELERKGKKGYTNTKIAHDVLSNARAESSVRRIKKRWLEEGSYRGYTGEKPLAAGTTSQPTSKRGFFTGKRYVFTSAQNNTFVHEGFLASLHTYCSYNDAELVVSSFQYNKNGFQKGACGEVWYDSRIKEFLCDRPMQVAEGLVYCGELSIIPTAVTPLSGLYNYTGADSAIVPHAKLQLESVPSPKWDTPKIMYTTGCVTQMNYVQMKSGQKAEWTHSFSALVVEIDEDGDWFVRQLAAKSDTGEFYDLGKYYAPSGVVTTGHTLEAINYGDIHAAGLDETVADISWKDEESILDVLKPKYQFLSDVFDHRNKNHHNIGDHHFLFKMFNNKTESVLDEIKLTAEVIKSTIRPFSKTVVVESNHNLALTKWLKEQDYRKDPVNALFFLEMQTEVYKAIVRGEELPVFDYACNNYVGGMEDVLFLKEDESMRVAGNIEMGQHGHLGTSGARPSIQSYLKLGIKHNLGHVHGAAIRDGVYYAGMSGKLNQGYNKGASCWNQSHIVTYANGKRAIITLKNGKWRGNYN